ncbi:GGDEF domain-containing protein [Actinoplanes sp. NPDC089786]|uniref:GGDEF domain-containing protein n=1 Tax=Actinoplanes sp. NPDC089786 TaxID=3155185 RepID=UPI003413CA7D
MRPVAVGVVAGAALQAALIATGFAQPLVVVGGALVLAAALVGLVAHARRALGSSGAERRSWVCNSIALAAWVITSVLQLVDAAAGIQRVLPRPVDLLVLVSVGLPVVSLLSGPGARLSWNVRIRMILDGAMAASALFVVAWPYLLRPVYEQAGAEQGNFVVAVRSVQMVTLSLAIVLLSRSRARVITAHTMLALGYAALTVCGIAFSAITLYAHTWQLAAASGVFFAATVVLAAVAWYDIPAVESAWLPIATGARAGLPYAPVVLALIVAGAQYLGGHGDGAMLGALFLLFALVLVRQFLALRGNAQLLAEVERQREQLEYQATHDHLTALSNRKHLYQRTSFTAGEPVALMLIDLDGFKQVNDRYGHAAGDTVLVTVAEVLRTVVPPGHLIARLGGDEFVVLLGPAPSPEETRHIAERITVEVGASATGVGASIGLTYVRSGRATVGMLLSDADAALYQAKAAGKGRVALSPTYAST